MRSAVILAGLLYIVLIIKALRVEDVTDQRKLSFFNFSFDKKESNVPLFSLYKFPGRLDVFSYNGLSQINEYNDQTLSLTKSSCLLTMDPLIHSITSNREILVNVNTTEIFNRNSLLAVFGLNIQINDLLASQLNNDNEIIFIYRMNDDINAVINKFFNDIIEHANLTTDFDANQYILDGSKEIVPYIQKFIEKRSSLQSIAKDLVYDMYNIYGELNLVLGSNDVNFDGISKFHENYDKNITSFIEFDYQTLDITSIYDFKYIFDDLGENNIIDKIVLEHVIEHLTLPEAIVSLKNIYTYLRPGGKLRVAVPDFNYKLKQCIFLFTNNSENININDNITVSKKCAYECSER